VDSRNTWVGPLTIDQLLDGSLDGSCPKPPEANGVYLISQKRWNGSPTPDCTPLYVGGNERNPKLFRKRIGDLIADMFGFFSPGVDNAGHHGPAQRLHDYCGQHRINPKSLYIGWLKNCTCYRCVENDLYDKLKPSINKKRPGRCQRHPTQLKISYTPT
jgi:hypothetical protein